MYKILVVDKCCFSRFGLKTWFNQEAFREKGVIITEADNLQLAREMMVTWKPNLIIADFTSFITTLKNIRRLSLIHETQTTNTSIILLQSNHHTHIGDVSKNRGNIYILDKSIDLNELEIIIKKTIAQQDKEKTKKSALMPLLTLREERILKLWKDEAHNAYIARLMGISIKTVYTYKRNIRVKLGAGNRLSLFMNMS
ncbi:LuxR C-terminal-related transcriptional regulator [uncultured Cedecea sp.]|uniref:LuxR C-terminal-related transcriptional regulator n=1 Tax=uncultured Cedecea sp. TaxID=988762 RepID=UPI0026321EBE|nr:LuxR C-terminal-related transcriptional regulator [uncultured Cedecea sp.]